MINKFEDNMIVICPNDYKNKFLTKLSNELLDVKFMTIDELIKNIVFDYDEKTIFYIMNKYNVSYELALIYITNIYYVNESSFNEKLIFLSQLKKDLIKNNKLYINNISFKYFNHKKIVFYGYPNLKYYRKILSTLSNIEIIEEPIKNKKYEIYKYDNIYEEIISVGIKILNMIEKKIDINNIKLMNISNEYEIPIIRIFSIMNIPININLKESMISIPLIKDYIDLLEETKNIEESLNIIKNKYNLNIKENIDNYNLLITLLNNYDNDDSIENIILSLSYKVKNWPKKSSKLNKAIDIINNNDYIDKNDYVFLMGFNEENIPRKVYDDDYLTDIEKKEIGIDTSIELNQEEKKYILNKISSIEHLVISYKLKTPFNVWTKSSLIDMEGKEYILKDKYNYCELLNKIEFKKNIELYNKYYIINKNLPLLLNNYYYIIKDKYNNKYKKINQDILKKYKNKVVLSYSSMENFYKCPFKYYINDYLKLSVKQETFDLMVGSIFHNVLSHCFEETFDLNKYYSEYIKDKKLSHKELYFINKLKTDLVIIINEIKNQLKYSTFDKYMLEEKIFLDIDSEIKLSFVGIIDKIMYKEENEKIYLAIIDYKTGNPNTSLDNITYGIGMQLPIYLYLSKNMDNFKKTKIVGIYYQKILDNEIHKKEEGFKYLELQKENLKLQGYSINDCESLEKFDKTYKNSLLIKQMKMTNNGFYAYAKTMDENKIDELIKLTENKIKEAGYLIYDGEFEIKPKILNNKNISCEYCEFNDICYMTNHDVEYLKEEKVL